MVTETDQVLAKVVQATGQSVDLVARLVGAFREAIDALLAQGAIVATGELFMSFGDSPTRRGLLERLNTDLPVPSDVLRGDGYATAKWLFLPPTVYDEHPLANRPHVMPRAIEILGGQAPGLPVLWEVLDAWDATFADGRKYRVSSVGLEMAAEVWLVEHLPRLRLHGFPVDLVRRQYVLPSGKRPDLLCRFNDSTNHAEIDDWLVIQMKVTSFYPEAAEQLEKYVAEIAETAGSKVGVHGLLITDGAHHAEVEDLQSRGLAHLSLAALGYRLHLAQESLKQSTPSTADSHDPTPVEQSERITTSSLSASIADGVTAVVDGPEVYWARLFGDQRKTEHGQSERAGLVGSTGVPARQIPSRMGR